MAGMACIATVTSATSAVAASIRPDQVRTGLISRARRVEVIHPQTLHCVCTPSRASLAIHLRRSPADHRAAKPDCHNAN